MSQHKNAGVTVEALKHHTFNGQAYAPGETYQVQEGAGQTVEQYVDSLRATGLAKVASESSPLILNEIGTPGEPQAPAPPASAPKVEPVAPPKPARAAPAKSAPKKK